MPTYAIAALVVYGLFFLAGIVWGAFSDWYSLATLYPNRPEAALLKLDGWQGSINDMGFKGDLTLSACRTGLRLETSRFFHPFCRPLLVPWAEIQSEFKKAGSWDVYDPVVLTFGEPPAGRLKIDSKIWTRLVEASEGAWANQPA